MSNLRKEIESAVNRCSAENESNTPDFILAEYLTDCLAAFDKASGAREKWYGAVAQGKGPAPTPDLAGKVEEGVRAAAQKFVMKERMAMLHEEREELFTSIVLPLFAASEERHKRDRELAVAAMKGAAIYAIDALEASAENFEGPYHVDKESAIAKLEALPTPDTSSTVRQIEARARLEEHDIDCKECIVLHMTKKLSPCDRRMELERALAEKVTNPLPQFNLPLSLQKKARER